MKPWRFWLIENNLLQNDIQHTIGNPVFAIETNLEPLRKRIKTGKVNEALQIVDEIEASLSRIKEVILTPSFPNKAPDSQST